MKITANLLGNKIESNSSLAFSLYEKSKFGEKQGSKITYSVYEAAYLVEAGKIDIFFGKKNISERELVAKFSKIDKNFSLRYEVYKDLRKKGLIPKAALKYGTDFRVYENTSTINEQHAKWLLICFSENSKLSWNEFTAKNRIAHSTNKKLLIAIVDSEQEVSYYESNWLKL